MPTEVRIKKFSSEFQKNLFPDNSFWSKSKSDGSIADSVTEVQIPQAGIPVSSTFGAIQDGQANLDIANKLDPKVRLNLKKTYSIETFGTDAVALQGIDLKTFPYEKRSELFQEHSNIINTDVANYAAVQFAQDTANTALIVQTTGTDNRENLVQAAGGFVGNVRKITKDDVIGIKKIFHKMNIPSVESGLFSLITPEQWNDLLLIPEFVDYEKTGRESKLKQGIVGTLMGFEFMIRQNDSLEANVVYNAATNTKTAFGAALTGTETSAAIFWHSSLVRHAKGTAKLYIENQDPVFKADVFASETRFGAAKSRTDGKGVVSLIEATV